MFSRNTWSALACFVVLSMFGVESYAASKSVLPMNKVKEKFYQHINAIRNKDNNAILNLHKQVNYSCVEGSKGLPSFDKPDHILKCIDRYLDSYYENCWKPILVASSYRILEINQSVTSGITLPNQWTAYIEMTFPPDTFTTFWNNNKFIKKGIIKVDYQYDFYKKGWDDTFCADYSRQIYKVIENY